MGKLTGKVAVVTGASRASAPPSLKHYAAEGASVVVNYASSKAGADASSRRSRSTAARRSPCKATCRSPTDIERLFAETKKAFGRLDILVNNAGVYEFAPLEQVTPEHFHKQFDLNVSGCYWPRRKRSKQFGDAGGSDHQHQLGRGHCRAAIRRSSTAQQRPRSTPSRKVSPRNSARARSASTRSIPAWSRPKACGRPASPRATSDGKSRPRRRSAASASRRTSPRSRSSWPPTIPAGSPAKPFTFPAAIGVPCPVTASAARSPPI